MSKKKKQSEKTSNKVCPYSSSCFECPLSDCKISSIKVNIAKVNVLPYDLEYHREERNVQRVQDKFVN